jgi:hypothetical protein
MCTQTRGIRKKKGARLLPDTVHHVQAVRVGPSRVGVGPSGPQSDGSWTCSSKEPRAMHGVRPIRSTGVGPYDALAQLPLTTVQQQSASTVACQMASDCRKVHRRSTYVWGRSGAITELLDRKFGPCEAFLMRAPCEGLQWGSGRSLCAFWYLSKNIGLIDGNLYLYLPYLYCYLGCVLYFPSLDDRLVDRIGILVV